MLIPFLEEHLALEMCEANKNTSPGLVCKSAPWKLAWPCWAQGNRQEADELWIKAWRKMLSTGLGTQTASHPMALFNSGRGDLNATLQWTRSSWGLISPQWTQRTKLRHLEYRHQSLTKRDIILVTISLYKNYICRNLQNVFFSYSNNKINAFLC